RQTTEGENQKAKAKGQKSEPQPHSSDSGPRTPNPGLVLRMKFTGANPQPLVTGIEELAGKAHYFIGKDPNKWRTHVPVYAKIKYEAVYPGVDLVYYGNQQVLEYGFVVAPGADPKVISLDFEGADKVEVDAQGDLVLHTAIGHIRQRKPLIYQEVGGVRQEIAGGYVLLDPKTPHSALRTALIGFKVAQYDSTKPLIIDPVLWY